MANIIKFPVKPAKLGFKKVHKHPSEPTGQKDQLNLFVPKNKILELTPNLSLFDQALLMDERGDERAVDQYQKAIDEGDAVADAYCNLGIIESQKGNASKAFDCFTKSLEKDPRHLESHYNLGNLYFDMGDLRLAKLHYEIATEIDTHFPSVYYNLGVVFALNNEYEKSYQTLRTYQELVPAEEAKAADELLYGLKKSLSSSN